MAAAAYRAGEKLHSEYYGEINNYTRKGGVFCSEILLPSHAPPEYADRETLWNAVEKAERGQKAQLAYSFDIALQNEFSIQENIALARQFLLDNFVSRGMVVDFAVHSPDKEDGGISNPHFHVMCPIRPIETDGRWGKKQRREYVLDEHCERVLDEAGNYVFNAVPTTDWGKPETLEAWRQAWAGMCNAKFAQKGLDYRIDHRSFARQGVEQIPTQHEGPTVRAMEAKGIRTDKGDLNRFIRKTNALLCEAKEKIAALIGWLKDVKAELSKPQPPTLNDLLALHCANRNKGAYSNKAKNANLQRYVETFSFLQSKKLYTVDDLENTLHAMQDKIDTLKKSASAKQTRIKEVDELLRMVDYYKSGKFAADKLKSIRFEKSRQKYKTEHDDELRTFYMAERKLKPYFKDGKLPITAWRRERERLVLKHIQAVMGYILRHEDYFCTIMEEQLRVESYEQVRIRRKRLESNERRIAELKRLFIKIYEDNASRRLTDERYDMLSQTYEAEQKQLEAEAITLQQEIEVQERQNENLEKFIQKAHKYVGIEELDGYALRELVSAIYVDAPDKSGGKRVQHIHIKYDGLGFIPLNELMKKETA